MCAGFEVFTTNCRRDGSVRSDCLGYDGKDITGITASFGIYLSDKGWLMCLPTIECGFIKPGKHINNVFITVMETNIFKEMFHLNRNLNNLGGPQS